MRLLDNITWAIIHQIYTEEIQRTFIMCDDIFEWPLVIQQIVQKYVLTKNNFSTGLLQAEDIEEVFDIIHRQADLSMNRVVVLIKDYEMQDKVKSYNAYHGFRPD